MRNDCRRAWLDVHHPPAWRAGRRRCLRAGWPSWPPTWLELELDSGRQFRAGGRLARARLASLAPRSPGSGASCELSRAEGMLPLEVGRRLGSCFADGEAAREPSQWGVGGHSNWRARSSQSGGAKAERVRANWAAPMSAQMGRMSAGRLIRVQLTFMRSLSLVRLARGRHWTRMRQPGQPCARWGAPGPSLWGAEWEWDWEWES